MPANPNCPRCGGTGRMGKKDITEEEYYYSVVLPTQPCYCTQGKCGTCGADARKYVDWCVTGQCFDCDNKEVA